MDQALALIRYRFDTLEQLSRHLHMVDDAALIFLPEPEKASALPERVMVELVLREPSQETVVRGAVVSRAEGQVRGSWLQLADTRLAMRLRYGRGLEGRREGRVSADHLVQLHSDYGDHFIAQILDVSSGGMRVHGARGLLVGGSYGVRLLGEKPVQAELGVAHVARLEGSEAGLRFVLAGNPPVLQFVESLREAWKRAPEIVHLAGCCARDPIEPALPRLGTPATAG
jgi:hypothetical protein